MPHIGDAEHRRPSAPMGPHSSDADDPIWGFHGCRALKMTPKTPKLRPQMKDPEVIPNGPKMTPNGPKDPKRPQNGPKMTLKDPKMALNEPKMT